METFDFSLDVAVGLAINELQDAAGFIHISTDVDSLHVYDTRWVRFVTDLGHIINIRIYQGPGGVEVRLYNHTMHRWERDVIPTSRDLIDIIFDLLSKTYEPRLQGYEATT